MNSRKELLTERERIRQEILGLREAMTYVNCKLLDGDIAQAIDLGLLYALAETGDGTVWALTPDGLRVSETLDYIFHLYDEFDDDGVKV